MLGVTITLLRPVQRVGLAAERHRVPQSLRRLDYRPDWPIRQHGPLITDSHTRGCLQWVDSHHRLT